MARTLSWLYRRLGPLYFAVFAVFDLLSAAIVGLATLGMMSLYVDGSATDFARILAVIEGCVLLGTAWALLRAVRVARPILAWMRRRGDPGRALAAWRAGVEMPRRTVVEAGWQPFVLVSVPIAAYATWELELPPYSALFMFAGALVSIAYAGVLNFFATEQFARPIVLDIVRDLPADFTAPPAGVPLRWKLLGALPLINVITGVVVAGLSDAGRASLEDLGVNVIVAVVVAFTISLELTLLVTGSLLAPVRSLVTATERVARGDLSTRVPVVSGDELGALASSFNAMVRGLEEREALREAFGSYVDPEIAERVLEHGASLEGEEIEATLMFVDIRDFTAWSERASAREAVAHLNRFFDLVVPIVARHGGHANKFVGDGLLAVFGAPVPVSDHADRAISAACEIESAVEEQLGPGLRIGIGINSGPVVAGSIGGGGRLEYTVIGDPVNVAARVERQTRESGDTVLVTEATRCLVTRPDFELEARGSVALRGKARPVPIHAARLLPAVESLGKTLQSAKRGSRSARERSTT